MSDYSYHNPVGNPCDKCGLPAVEHRVKHRAVLPDGSPCMCGATHRSRNEKGSQRRSPSQLQKRKRKERSFFAGMDGEGKGRSPHRYTLLAVSDKTGKKRFWVENENGLSTEQCLDFMLGLPSAARTFSFAFFYDISKILEDMTKTEEGRKALYLLFRPNLRRRLAHRKKFGPRPVRWSKYTLNLMGKRFTVSSGKRRRVVWDVFAFFQKRFVRVLEDWKIGSKKLRARMQRMKELRPEFDKLPPAQRREYCFSECRCLADLVQQLDKAHDDAGIPLRRYDGAGSTASSILRTMRIADLKRDPPPEMKEAVAMAFFGGRFEHSVIGPVPGPLFAYDISGAYPYHMAQLPCLVHANWVRTHDRARIDGARAALIRYSLEDAGERMPWGPFPFREKNGTIVFPSRSSGGWVWKEEYLAGERQFKNVRFHEAWILESNCDCPPPFAGLSEFYIRRIMLGSEARGLILKTGLAACAGKLMQSVGYMPPFQNWIWAGMTTAGPRAQFLDVLGLHEDRHNLLAIATDGIFTREEITPPEPVDVGTFVLPNGKPNPKPLGGWVKKVANKGVFFAKPGVYFPLKPTKKEIEEVRARGLGRKNVWENWEKIVEAWRERRHAVHLPSVARFHGAKSSITKSGNSYTRSSDYGEWDERPIGVTLGAFPKRLRMVPVAGTEYARMTLRAFPDGMFSEPYRGSMKSPEAQMLIAARAEIEEQPEGDDYADYSMDE